MRHDLPVTSPQPGWYADPAAAHELRWWDGATWTAAVTTAGAQTSSPLPLPDRTAPVSGTTAGSSGPLLTAPVLVLVREPGAGLGVLDEAGRRLGTLVETGRRRTGRRGTGRLLDRLRPRALELRDTHGATQLLLRRPAGLLARPVVVERPGAGEVGRLVPGSGAAPYALQSGGRPLGSLDVQDGPGGDVRVLDLPGAEVARISRRSTGAAHPVGASVVRVHRPLSDPLRSLVVAAALLVDDALDRDAGVAQ